MNESKIEWCDSTVNFWSGCTKVSPGCANCYAERLSNRFDGDSDRFLGQRFGGWGPNAPRKLHENASKEAHRLNRRPWVCDECGKSEASPSEHWCVYDYPVSKTVNMRPKLATFHRRRIFPISIGDILDHEVPVEWLAWALDTIRRCDQVRWLLLTKRPELWEQLVLTCIGWDLRHEAHGKEFNDWLTRWANGHAPPHVLVGTSVEDQERTSRIADLLRIPAVGRFLSLEPLLGPVDLFMASALNPTDSGGALLSDFLNWIIVGGESGQRARQCNVEWIRSLIRQGREAGVPVFVKQLGAHIVDHDCVSPAIHLPNAFWPDGAKCIQAERRIVLRDRKGGNPAEWPEDLRVREYPEVLR